MVNLTYSQKTHSKELGLGVIDSHLAPTEVPLGLPLITSFGLAGSQVSVLDRIDASRQKFSAAFAPYGALTA